LLSKINVSIKVTLSNIGNWFYSQADSVVIVTYRNLKDNGSCTLHFCWHQSN